MNTKQDESKRLGLHDKTGTFQFASYGRCFENHLSVHDVAVLRMGWRCRVMVKSGVTLQATFNKSLQPGTKGLMNIFRCENVATRGYPKPAPFRRRRRSLRSDRKKQKKPKIKNLFSVDGNMDSIWLMKHHTRFPEHVCEWQLEAQFPAGGDYTIQVRMLEESGSSGRSAFHHFVRVL